MQSQAPAHPRLTQFEYAHGATRDLEASVELTPASSRERAVLQLSIDNRTSDSLRVAHAVQILDAKRADVVPPAPTEPGAAPASSRAQLAPLSLDLTAVEDGYYEIVVQTLAAPEAAATDKESQRWVPAHVYVAVDSSGVREVDFYEWYENSGANQMTITDDRIGPPIDDLEEYARKLVKGEL